MTPTRRLFGCLLALCLAGCACLPLPDAATVREIAPTGKLRVAFILGNPVQVMPDAAGELRGPAIDIGRELARRLGVPFKPAGLPRAEDIVASAASGRWDIAFLAFDPARTGELDFTPPYLLAHNSYLLPAGSPVRTFEDADRPGMRIGVGQRDAIDNHLSRTLKNAELVRNTRGNAGAVELLRSGQVDLYAANAQRLAELAAQLPGSSVIEGSLLGVGQAIAIPRKAIPGGRRAGLDFLRAALEELKTDGFIQRAIDRSRLKGATVAPGTK